jgi:hypothetical protein
MGSGRSFGPTVENMLVIGKKASNMGRAHSLNHQVKVEKENGLMEDASGGLMRVTLKSRIEFIFMTL